MMGGTARGDFNHRTESFRLLRVWVYSELEDLRTRGESSKISGGTPAEPPCGNHRWPGMRFTTSAFVFKRRVVGLLRCCRNQIQSFSLNLISSYLAKSKHRIDLCGSPRWKVAGHHGDCK